MAPDLKFTSSIVITRSLHEDWGCTNWKSGTARGIRFPQLAELRKRFDAKHGRQQWSDSPDGDWD